jgi:hypothetical protein
MIVPSVSASELAALKAAIEKFARESPGALGSALYQEGLVIEAESVKLCPVATGRLRSTHYVSPPTMDTRGVPAVTVSYGTDYAVAVHERTEVAHNPPTQAKFLETPFRAAQRGMLDRLRVSVARFARFATIYAKGR